MHDVAIPSPKVAVIQVDAPSWIATALRASLQPALVPRATSKSMSPLPALRAFHPARQKRAPSQNCTGAASASRTQPGSVQCWPMGWSIFGSTSGAERAA